MTSQIGNLQGQHISGKSMLQYALQTPEGDIDLQNQYKIINAVNGVNQQDYATIAQLTTGTSQPLNIISTTYPNTGNIDMNNKIIENMQDPIQNQDAVTKIYVDNALSNVDGGGGSIPVGFICPYWSTSAPTNWLYCDGSTFNQLTYPELYTFLGNSNILPDLRGYFLRGNGGGVDPSGSRSIGNVQNSANLSHSHGFSVSYERPNYTTEPIQAPLDTNRQYSNNSSTTGLSGSTNADGSSESRPINKAVAYMIKAKNEITTRNNITSDNDLYSVTADNTGQIVVQGNIDLQNAYKVINAIDPTDLQDYTTKNYVDTQLSNIATDRIISLDTNTNLIANNINLTAKINSVDNALDINRTGIVTSLQCDDILQLRSLNDGINLDGSNQQVQIYNTNGNYLFLNGTIDGLGLYNANLTSQKINLICSDATDGQVEINSQNKPAIYTYDITSNINDDKHIVNKKYVDNQINANQQSLNNISINQPTSGNVDINNYKLINVLDPTSNLDAVNKQYVDTAVGALSGGSGLQLANWTCQNTFTTGSVLTGWTKNWDMGVGVTQSAGVFTLPANSQWKASIYAHYIVGGITGVLSVVLQSSSNTAIYNSYTNGQYQGKCLTTYNYGPIFAASDGYIYFTTAQVGGTIRVYCEQNSLSPIAINCNLYLERIYDVQGQSLDQIAITNPTAGNVNINNHKLTNVSDPTSNLDSANKQYVDNAISNISQDRIISLDTNTNLVANNTNIVAKIDSISNALTLSRTGGVSIVQCDDILQFRSLQDGINIDGSNEQVQIYNTDGNYLTLNGNINGVGLLNSNIIAQTMILRCLDPTDGQVEISSQVQPMIYTYDITNNINQIGHIPNFKFIKNIKNYQQVFYDITPGTGKTWTVPSNVYSIKVLLHNAGTGNMQHFRTNFNQIRMGQSGATGSCIIKYLQVIPGQNVTYTIQSGGTSATGGNVPNNIPASTFTYNSITYSTGINDFLFVVTPTQGDENFSSRLGTESQDFTKFEDNAATIITLRCNTLRSPPNIFGEQTANQYCNSTSAGINGQRGCGSTSSAISDTTNLLVNGYSIESATGGNAFIYIYY